MTLFEGLATADVVCRETRIHARCAGSGPPLLLLHGYPQTHTIWHKVAPALAERFSVVASDLRGYGDSGKPLSDPAHLTYSKRASARDQVELMAALGFREFFVAGHDRGGRVAHRMALDHPETVRRLALLDIVPTHKIFATVNKEVATGYYHWFFLIQGNDLPETMIGHDPEFYLRAKLRQWSGSGLAPFSEAALAEYVRCFSDAACIHSSCEDYRAAASVDLEHDDADLWRRIACPVLVLWGEHGLMERHYNVLDTWHERAADVRGRKLPCGHFLPEECPEETLREFVDFFAE